MPDFETSFHIPTYEEVGRELAESADIDSLDTVEFNFMITEEGAAEFGLDPEVKLDLEHATDEDYLVLALMGMIKMGNGFAAKLFGVEVDIIPRQSEPGPTEPPKPDPSGDREPRDPLPPTNAGAMALPIKAETAS